jgi:hypothetical protein
MTPEQGSVPELQALVTALGPLTVHVQVLATTATGGFMLRMRRNAPPDVREAIYTLCGRHAEQLRSRPRKKVAGLSATCPATEARARRTRNLKASP